MGEQIRTPRTSDRSIGYEDVARFINSCDDEIILRYIINLAQSRLKQLREERARPWSEAAVQSFWIESPDSARTLIRYIVEHGGVAFLSDIKRDLGWDGKKTGAVVGGLNNRARRNRFRDVIRVEWTRRNGEWDARYSLDQDFLRAIRAVLGS